MDGNEVRFCWTLRAAKGGKAGRARLGLACLGKLTAGAGSPIDSLDGAGRLALLLGRRDGLWLVLAHRAPCQQIPRSGYCLAPSWQEFCCPRASPVLYLNAGEVG